MSKGNLFLGMGRGSVGDVTFYRSYGQQCARARNRNPRNPKTDAQVIQRMILATASKAYSRLKPIVNHSFEGVEYGGKSQSFFLKKACDDIRAFVAANYPTQTAASLAEFIGLAEPEFLAGAGIGLLISKGSLPSIAVSYEDETPLFGTAFSGTVSGVPTIGQIMEALSVSPGDQITAVTLNPNGLFVKSRWVIAPDIDATGKALPWQASSFANPAFAEVEYNENAFITNYQGGNNVTVVNADGDALACSIILSRKDGSKWLRSTQRLMASTDDLSTYMSENGPVVVIPIWMAGTSQIQSENPYYLNQAEQG